MSEELVITEKEDVKQPEVKKVEAEKNFSFRTYAWKQFKKNKPAYYSYKVLVVLAIIALLAPLLANDQPLYMKYKGTHLFPALSFSNTTEIKDPETGEIEIIQYDIADWKRMDAETVIFPPVAYSPNTTDLDNSDYVSPGGEQVFVDKDGNQMEMPLKFKHWLGTNKRGEDVLSGLIHGTRISLTIGLLSMGVASILGILLGSLAGYYGDRSLITKRGSFWLFALGLIVAFFYGFQMRSYDLVDGLATSGFAFIGQLLLSFIIFGAILYAFHFAGKMISRLPFFNKQVFIPVDSIIMRTIEILISIPLLILIISVAAIAKPSIVNLMLIIGLTSWTQIARLTRAEFLRIRNMEYIQAAKSLGFKESKVILKHALPNGLAPAFVAIAFGIASAILIESSLSFLGIGVPADVVTWGSLLSAGRENFNAWWLVVFPGLAIFLTVTIYNLLGEGLRDALDPRLKK